MRWCGEKGVRQAVVGGFFVRPDYAPLGQVRIAGEPRPSVAFEAPWGDMRACVHIADGMLRIERRDELDAEPAGDLLQAGPLLGADGRRAIADGEDGEGFSAAAHQFDSERFTWPSVAAQLAAVLEEAVAEARQAPAIDA